MILGETCSIVARANAVASANPALLGSVVCIAASLTSTHVRKILPDGPYRYGKVYIIQSLTHLKVGFSKSEARQHLQPA